MAIIMRQELQLLQTTTHQGQRHIPTSFTCVCACVCVHYNNVIRIGDGVCKYMCMEKRATISAAVYIKVNAHVRYTHI